jgi:hypothetical protein
LFGGLESKRVKGVEPSSNQENTIENHAILEAGGVKASPPISVPMPADEDFLAVALAWPALPKAIKSGILAMIIAIA